ncbi:hypothetical protein HELRODRAFT_92396 [Helobdella robusta]|uniref:Uncharacterized protein n=1 Tax=Helobdella robusta TaxID=6412 RepID=T1G8F6_HELRO|nr:hypothetical protein HELRODRAFT_92396 [Helobdella robusta]ESO07063.1 hypothetical protein HELRODRAFT_92396 [Helobdella robusta]
MTANLNTTAHGIPNYARANGKFKKMFWGLTILLMTSGMVFNIYELTQRYMDRPKQVTLSITRNDALNFPSVTICNMNPVKKSALDGQRNTSSLQQFSFFPIFFQLIIFLSSNLLLTRNMIFCHIEGLSIMVVNIDQMDYVKQAGSLAGIRVVILDQNQMPFPEDEGVSVGPGQLTYISLQRHEINRLGSPYGSCTEQLFDPFTSAYSAFYNVQYRAKGCEYTCYQKKIMHECGCIDFSYLNITALMENINADNMSLCQSGNFEQG